MADYIYTKIIDIARLKQEIEASAVITIALDTINALGSQVTISFKAVLPAADESELNNLVAAHVPTPLETKALTVDAFTVKDPSGIPQVHASPKPVGYTSYFSSCGDTGTGDVTGHGQGNCLKFRMLSTDSVKSVDVTFSEDVYIKDGLILPRGAPFGASVDVEVVHPVYGVLFAFCRHANILGDFPVELDTDDRAHLPLGLILRITVRNATGTGDDDPAADFVVAGRVELFRPYPL